MMNNRSLGWIGIVACASVLGAALNARAPAAIAAGPSAAPSDEGVPETSIVPAEGESSGAEASPGAGARSPAQAGMTPGPVGAPTVKAHHTTVHHAPAVPAHFDVEPADAVLKVVKADWVYS